MSTSKRLIFELKVNGGLDAYTPLYERFHPAGEYVLNSKPWRGLERHSCRVTSFHSRTRSMNDPSPLVVDIEVSYRPRGFVSYSGRTRYDGWDATTPQRNEDGLLVNAEGAVLKDGERPVYEHKQVYGETDFNNLEFGTLVREETEGELRRMKLEDIFQELGAARGAFKVSMKESSFMAPRRNRLATKIVLSNQPDGRVVRGGDEMRLLSLARPQFEHALMDAIFELMCDFMEGRVSIKNISGKDFTYVELSSALVDCEPNEKGLSSLFDVLQSYTPIDFLENLAKRLVALYAVKADIVQGAKSGIVLRREQDGGQ